MPFVIPLDELENLLPKKWKALPKESIYKPKVFRQKLKIKSECPYCTNKWTSMKGMIEFHIGSSRSGNTKYISCQLYQQTCKMCKIYIQPDYYDEEFKDIIIHVTNRFNNPKKEDNSYPIRSKKGNPRGFHLNCEACDLGIIDH